MFPADVVGVNAVALSSLMLVGGVAHLNMSHALLRFVPVAGTAARRLVALGYLVAVVVSASPGPVSRSARSGGHPSWSTWPATARSSRSSP